jgi:formylglycine-generating enzyme required for sulfatase activity
MAFLDQLLLIGEPYTTTRAPHDGTGFVYSNIASESPKEIDRFYDPGSDRGGRGRDSGLYFGAHITTLNTTTALFFNGSANGPNRATDVIQFEQTGKASPVGTLEFPHAIQWPAGVQDNVMVCLERDKDGGAHLAEYAVNGQVITRTEIQNIDVPGAAIPGGKPPVSPLHASAGYLAALIPTTADGKEPVLFAFSRRSDGVYETLFTRQEHTGASYTSHASHAVSDGFVFLTTRVAELGVAEGEIRVLNLAQKGQLEEKLPRSSAANVKTHGSHVWAFHDLVVVRDELETGAALRLFRRGFGKRKSSLTSTGRNDESAMAQAAPAPAIAPFDTAQAKAHQQAWADHLGVPVESTNSIGMKLVLISPGEFMMGSPESEPGRDKNETQHKVMLTQPFQMGMHEVTQQQYEEVMGSNPSQFKGANNPVENVNWDDAMAYCSKLSSLPAEVAAGRVYRLPTEAEWEYACRAGTTTEYSFGDDAKDLVKYAWFDGNSGKTTHAVGGKLPNVWGLYDMHGNVWEWCSDAEGSYRVRRGGSWSDSARICRSAFRGSSDPSLRGSNLGFRLALSPSGQ